MIIKTKVYYKETFKVYINIVENFTLKNNL